MNKKDILYYGYYDENGKYIAVLNTDKLKELFNADIVELYPEKDLKN